MSDNMVQISTLKKLITQFVREREWEQFHTPKNLTTAISVEAAELMEIFQWASVEESMELTDKPEIRARIEEELADVLIYCLALANRSGIDVSDAVIRKIEQNAIRYPASVYKGRY